MPDPRNSITAHPRECQSRTSSTAGRLPLCPPPDSGSSGAGASTPAATGQTKAQYDRDRGRLAQLTHRHNPRLGNAGKQVRRHARKIAPQNMSLGLARQRHHLGRAVGDAEMVDPDNAQLIRPRRDDVGLGLDHGPQRHLLLVRDPQGQTACRRDQCDISTGTVMCRSRSRVTPPMIISRVREWP
jgi:hypothetical protein